MLSLKGDRLNQVCEIHTKFKSQVIKGMCIACLLFGILPLGGDFDYIWWTYAAPPLGNWPEFLVLGQIPTPCPHSPPPPHGVYIDRCIKTENVWFSEKDIERQVFERRDLFTRWQMRAYLNQSTVTMTQPKANGNAFSFWLCYKRNGKCCSCATIELWMHLGGLLSTQDARVSFVLSNLPRASLTRWLHAARLQLPFPVLSSLSFQKETS